MPDLIFSRSHVAPPLPFVGHQVTLPALPSVAELTKAGLDPQVVIEAWNQDRPHFWRLLDAPALLAGVGRPTQARLWGVVVPTPWERAFLDWACAELGCTLRDDTTSAGPCASVSAALRSPLAAWPASPPATLSALAATDTSLEALGVAQALRTELATQPISGWPAWCDNTLILLPRDPTRLATWRRVLGEHGLPALTEQVTSLADSVAGRWLCALADLAGWDRAAVSREALRRVLLAPLYSTGDASRGDIRSLLRSLRRPTVDLALWCAHVRGHFIARAARIQDDIDLTAAERDTRLSELDSRRDGLLTLSETLATALRGTGDGTFWTRLRALVIQELGVRARLLASQAVEARAGFERCLGVLDELDGQDPQGTAHSTTLADALAGKASRTGALPDHGVRLQSWDTWDGRGASRVVLAGLEDGGYPRPPGRRVRADRPLATALGLLDGPGELERQAEVAATAAQRAGEHLWLTWSLQDAAGTRTFPGALVATLPPNLHSGDRLPEPWRDWLAHVVDRRALPQPAATISDPRTAQTLAHALPPSAAPAPAVAADLARRRLAAERDATVRSARSQPTPGPWTGQLGAPLLTSETRVSPTSLEVLGACPIRYLLGKELRVASQDDAGADLDPLESGNMVHGALARPAITVLQRNEPWDLSQPPIDEAVLAAERELTGGLNDLRSQDPSLSAGLVGALGDRWKQTLRLQLEEESDQGEGGLFPVGPCPDLDDVPPGVLQFLIDGAASDAERKELLAWQRLQSAVPVILAFLDASLTEALGTKGAADVWRKNSGVDFVSLLKAPEVKTLGGTDPAARSARVTELKALVAERFQTHNWRAKAAKRFAAAHRADRVAVPRRVVAAEWSFGRPGDDESDPHSVEHPLVVDCGANRSLQLKGQVDRVDAAADRPDLAVVDYKSGARTKSSGALGKGFGRGTDLQLPIYAAAVGALLPAAAPGLVQADAHVEVGRLAFVRKGSEGILWLSEHGELWDAEGDEPKTTAQALSDHLAHAHDRLSSGVLPLHPRHCPLQGDRDARCDYQHTCGLDVDAQADFTDPAPQPHFSVHAAGPASSSGKPKKPPRDPGPQPLDPVATIPDAASARTAHEAVVARASDVSRDATVSAGAGSGKTRALVARYEAALLDGASPEEILAITFTRKATAELRSRARQRVLGLSAHDHPEQAHWLRALGTAPIMTIDAFAGWVIEELSDEPVTVAGDERQWANTWLEARLIDQAEAPSADLRTLLDALPLPKLRKVLAALVLGAQAPKALPALAGRSADDQVAEWGAALDQAHPTLGHVLGGLQQDFAGEMPDGARSALGPDDAERLQVLDEHLARLSEASAELGSLGLLWALATTELDGKSKGWDPGVFALKSKLTDQKRTWTNKETSPTGKLAARLTHDSVTTLAAALAEEAETTLAAVRLARRWRQALDEARTEQGKLGYDDVVRRALHLLQDQPLPPESIRQALPLRHVLVDELQDTNGLQVQLIDALCAALTRAGVPVRRFGVGDPKQSIYRFRGAEVDLFQEQLSEDTQELRVCWRSQPALTRSFSRLFERLLAGSSSGQLADPEAAVPWAPLAPWADKDDGPCIELLHWEAPPEAEVASDRSENDQASEDEDETPLTTLAGRDLAVARRLAALVQESKTAGWTEGLAVLCHSWNRATHWGRVLQKAGLPAFVQGGRGLLETPEIRMVLDVLTALESEDDDLAWLSLLRGPLVGLSDPGLLCLHRGWGLHLRSFQRPDDVDGDGPWHAPAPSRVRLSRLRHGWRFDATAANQRLGEAGSGDVPAAVASALTSDARRLESLQAWWSELSSDWGLVPLSDTVRRLTESTGLRTLLHARGTSGDPEDAARALHNLRAFEALVETVSAEGRSLAGDTVRHLRQLCAAGDDPADGGVNLHAGAAITITTVHQAKGLEWDAVVLPDLDKVGVQSRGGDLAPVRRARSDGQSFTRDWHVGSLNADARDPFSTHQGIGGLLAQLATLPDERAENRRLLYVACTRARERLVLGGPWPRGTMEELTTEFAKLRFKRSGLEPTGLRHCGSWFDDLVVGLGLRPPSPPDDASNEEPEDAPPVILLPETDGTWQVDRDFTWVLPVADLPLRRRPSPALWPEGEDLLRATASVPHRDRVRCNPSGQHAASAPAADVRQPSGPSLSGTSPFEDPRNEGHTAHRALELWDYRGDLDDIVVARAVTDYAEPGADPAARKAWTRRLLDHALNGQPALVAELKGVAAAGRLFHEVTVRVPGPDGTELWEGSIDLLWQDDGGDWHLLDYKAAESNVELRRKQVTTKGKLAHYYPQVSAYAATLAGRLPAGDSVSTYGLWFLKDGLVAQWRA